MESKGEERNNHDHDGERDQKYRRTYERLNEILPTLPKEKGWVSTEHVQYKGFWINPGPPLAGVLLVEDHFKGRQTDIFIASAPKAGTIWLQSLIFAIINRARYDFSTHPLLKTKSDDLVPHLPIYIHKNEWNHEPLSSPRFFSMHFPYPLVPESLTSSGCKFVYICRDPKNVVVSIGLLINNSFRETIGLPPFTLEMAFDSFCNGTSPYGPYWDHVLGYWKASLENPENILFLKYEDVKRDPVGHVKKLAEFLGQPFSVKEENEGVVEEIIRLCHDVDVNKSSIMDKTDYYPPCEVGDWKNHLTPEMVDRLDRIMEEKLQGTGFSFGCSSN